MRGLPKCYLLHTDPSEFRELGKTRQATCLPLSTLNHWSFTKHTFWPSKPRLPKFPQWDSWAKKWDDVPWAWTMGFDTFLCESGLFWALEEIFPKSMIMLTWCGSPMKWSHVVWKIYPQHSTPQVQGPSKPRLLKFPRWDSWAWIMSQKMRWCAMSLNHGFWRLFVWIWALLGFKRDFPKIHDNVDVVRVANKMKSCGVKNLSSTFSPPSA